MKNGVPNISHSSFCTVGIRFLKISKFDFMLSNDMVERTQANLGQGLNCGDYQL
jgi:hypothetical protein